MNQIFTINNDTVVINKLSVGNTTLKGTLNISDRIVVDTIEVKTLITESILSQPLGIWTANLESELNGKGFSWDWGDGNLQFVYRPGNRLWTNGDIDLSSNKSYKIDNVEVISLTTLGSQVTTSNLTQVGSLTSLHVNGDTNIGDYAFFNANSNRLGLGTSNPNTAISIIDNGVEIGIGSPLTGIASIGTYSNHSLNIITNNNVRISVKNDGEIHIGNDTSKNSILRVFGSLYVDNLITGSNSSQNVGNWTVNLESELNGKGFSWNWGEGSLQLSYRSGNRLWSSGDIDLSSNKSYKIDNVEVISFDKLGTQITKSNLNQVGSLKSLKVVGDTNIGDYAFFNTTYNRLGLGTEEPNAAISIIDNDVEIGIGSPRKGLASIGTYSNHALDIITDNTTRISVKNDGEVHIGNATNKNSILRVFGSLYVDNLVSDTRIERTSPIEFTTSRDHSIYGKGLIWTGNGETRRLVMEQNPDRLWSSESFDLAVDKAYYINGTPVLSSSGLGNSITSSNLNTLGTLSSLTVSGQSTFIGTVDVLSPLTVTSVLINDVNNRFEHNSTGIHGSNTITVTANGSEVLYADNNEISIGDRDNNRKPVKIFGPLSIGISNPDPSIGLAVNGNISFSNKKFITGSNIPSVGYFNKGDICWNDNPTENGYAGWICLVPGTPGEWAPFGGIGHL